jgi:peroxiredoxin
VELRQALAGEEDLTVLYVMASNQIDAKTLRFVDELGLRDRVRFLRDDASVTIDAFGLRKQDAEPIEAGVPHPATYLIDRDGIVRFVDVREDFHVWLDPQELLRSLAGIP